MEARKPRFSKPTMSLASKTHHQNGRIFGIRWSSVDGPKRCKSAGVEEKLFIRFQKTHKKTEVFENALVWTGPKSVFAMVITELNWRIIYQAMSIFHNCLLVKPFLHVVSGSCVCHQLGAQGDENFQFVSRRHVVNIADHKRLQ